MGPGFKYHIVSISAIFFALTIGLVVGSVFVSPQFANRQQNLILQLQRTLNSDIKENRQEITQYKECVAALSPLALKGKLGTAAVAIIQTGDYPEDAARASDAIALAQPRGIVHLAITSAVDRSDEAVGSLLKDLHAQNPLVPENRDGLFQAIASVLARGDASETPLLPQYERQNLLKLTADDNYGLPVKCAVVVIGSRNLDSMRNTRVDIPLIRALLKQGINVVVCEGGDAAASDIPAVRVANIEVSTVDNIDTDIGQCALVLAFTGPRGYYGIKPGADHLLPALSAQ